jgi:hypothetical protein
MIQEMPPPPAATLNSIAEEEVTQRAGLTALDRASTLNERPINKRKPGQRKADANKRGKRHCVLCRRFNGDNAATCRGDLQRGDKIIVFTLMT